MRGQWRGTYVGTNGGEIVIEIDEMDDHFEGTAYVHDANDSLPSTFAFVRTLNKDRRQALTVNLRAIDPRNSVPTSFDQLASLFPDVVFPKTADAVFEWDDAHLSVSWKTDIGTVGSAALERGRSEAPSECSILPVQTWEQFKQFAVTLPSHRYIFRGQPGAWRLRTAFHRSGRSNLDRYLLHDLPIVHRQLSSTTAHKFDVRDPLQNAAFLNLIQHHGFPTPLLDWSYSPFVAAFFAYSNASGGDRGPVRIYSFDKERWCNSFIQLQNTATRRPHFSILEALALDNNRMVPQQALSSFTNVDDIESYIASKGGDQGSYLSAIDLPRPDRTKVLNELRLMGITAGALFPGLDGACAELRERFFPNDRPGA